MHPAARVCWWWLQQLQKFSLACRNFVLHTRSGRKTVLAVRLGKDVSCRPLQAEHCPVRILGPPDTRDKRSRVGFLLGIHREMFR